MNGWLERQPDNDLILRAFYEAVAKYCEIHGSSDAMKDGQSKLEYGEGRPSTSQASGVKVRREITQAQQPVVEAGPEACATLSCESGVLGPFHDAVDQPLQSAGSKQRFYKHHAVTSTKMKKQQRDSKQGIHTKQELLGEDATLSARTKAGLPTHREMQSSMPQTSTPAQPAFQQAFDSLPPGLGQDQLKSWGFVDPKLWQLGFLPPPPPPMFFGLGQGMFPGMVPAMPPWQQLQLFGAMQGALQGVANMPMMQRPPCPMWQPLAQAPQPPTAMQGETAAAGGMLPPAQPTAVACSTPPQPLVAPYPGFGCGPPMDGTFAAGVLSVEQLEAAARLKAAELGNQDLAQLLMAWYYAGYQSGKCSMAAPPDKT